MYCFVLKTQIKRKRDCGVSPNYYANDVNYRQMLSQFFTVISVNKRRKINGKEASVGLI